MHVEFKLVVPTPFKWQGEFTWAVTGPAATALSEPLPLPSTILGTLASLRVSTAYPLTKRMYSPEEVYELVYEALGSYEALRGPYLVCNDGEECLGLHSWGQGLMKLIVRDSSLEIRAGEKLSKVNPLFALKGTALRMDSRIVSPHYLYMQFLLDPQALHALGFKPAICVDILNPKELQESPERIVKFSGEGKIALLSIGKGAKLEESLKRVWGSAWKEEASDEEILTYVASPILLPLEKDVTKKLMNGEYVKINVKINCVARAKDAESKDEGREDNIEIKVPAEEELCKRVVNLVPSKDKESFMNSLKRFRVKITYLAPGFDTVRSCLRPLYPTIMPGSLLLVRGESPKKIFYEGAGLYRKHLWGTLIPLPTA